MNISIETYQDDGLLGLKPEHFLKWAHIDQLYPQSWSESAWLAISEKNKSHIIFEMTDDDRVIGFALFGLFPDESSHLFKIAFLSEYQRRGLATKLLEFSLSFLEKHGQRSVYLEVAEVNTPAIALYKKFQFQQLHHAKHYYSDGRHAYKMMLEFLNT